MTQARDDAGQFVSRFDEDLFAEILRRVAAGEWIKPICASVGIGKRTFYDWLDANPELVPRYVEACNDREDSIVEAARKTLRGKTEDQGGESTGDVQRDKAIAEFDLKILGKWNSKRWGDKVEHSGKVTLSHEDFLAKLPDPAAE